MKKNTLTILVILLTGIANAQSKVELSIGGSLTEAKKGALNLALDLFNSYGSVLDGTPQLITGNNWYFYAIPQANIKYGNGDAFNGFVVKGSGFFRFFHLTTVAGIPAVDYAQMQGVVPFSVGLETNKDFKNFNVVGELGIIPWWKTLPQYHPTMNKAAKYILNYTNFGVFIQGGNKFGKWGPSDSLVIDAGDIIGSNEKLDKGLCRLKVYANFSPRLLHSADNKFQLFAYAETTYWYDFLNRAHYYQVIAKVKLQLGTHVGFDFGYQRGSGAPNFNTGDQMTGNLILLL